MKALTLFAAMKKSFSEIQGFSSKCKAIFFEIVRVFRPTLLVSALHCTVTMCMTFLSQWGGGLSYERGGDARQKFGIKDGAYQFRNIFARFMTMRKKETLARAIEIQKENWG